MKQIEKCNLCEVCLTYKPINGIGNPNANIMFILSSADYYTIKDNSILNTPAGELIAKLLKMINLNIDDIYITHLIKGRTNGIKAKNITACKPYLQQEVNEVKPKIIVTFGTHALKVIGKTNKSIISYRNRALCTTNHTFIIPAFNFGYILSDARYHGLLLETFVNIYKIYITFVNPNHKHFDDDLHDSIKKLLTV